MVQKSVLQMSKQKENPFLVVPTGDMECCAGATLVDANGNVTRVLPKE